MASGWRSSATVPGAASWPPRPTQLPPVSCDHWPISPLYVVGDTHSDENGGLSGRLVGDIARERRDEPFSTLVDIALNDDLATIFWPKPPDRYEDWLLRSELWQSEHVLLGGSDAGAHIDRRCGAVYTTSFLADTLRGHGLISLEGAVRALTGAPAELFGIRDRGRIATGYQADLVLFDPAAVGSGPPQLVRDLPGGASRLVAESVGIVNVFVNGVATVREGKATGATPGTVLRSGVDTTSVTLR